ncbi:MAG: MerR family transcriptional regulator, partial [Actinomycetota bacterium]
VYACTSDTEVVDLLRSGQGVLGAVVAVGKVREQLQGTLRELRPVQEAATHGAGRAAADTRAKEG